MAERIELDLDLRQAASVAALKELLAGLEAVRAATLQVDASVNKLATSQTQVATTTEKVVQVQREMTLQAARLTGELEKHREKGIEAANAYVNMHAKGSGAIDGVNEKTGMLSKTTNSLVGQIGGMVSGYLGLQGALRLLSLIDERMRSIIGIQKELVGEKWAQDIAAKSIMDNLGLSGRTGEDQARRLASSVALQTAMTFEQSANLIGSGSSFGFDVRDKKGSETVQQIGKFAARVGLEGKDELDGLFNLVLQAQAQGLTTEQALAAMDVAGMKTGKSNQRAVMAAMVAAVAPAISKGVSFEEAVSQYAVLATLAPTAQAGADQTRMLYTASDAALPMVKKRFARFAAERGQLPAFRAATDDEFNATIAAGEDENSQAIRRMRQDLGELPEKGRIDDAQFEESIRRRREKGLISAEDEQLLRDERRLKVADREQRRRNIEIDLRQREKKARTALDTQREIEAFDQLGTSEKAAMIKAFAAAATSNEDRAALAEMMGGRPEQAAAVRNAASPAGRVLEQEVRGLMGDPSSITAMKRKNVAYRETSPAQNALAQVSRSAANVADVDRGMEMAERWQADVEAEANREIASGEAGLIGGTGSTLTDAGAKSDLMAIDIYARMRNFYTSLSPAEKASVEGQQVLKLIQWAKTRMIDAGPILRASQQSTMARNTAAMFFNFQDAIERRRGISRSATGDETMGSSPTTRPAAVPNDAAPSTQPSTPDEGENPAPGGVSSVHYNVSVGNLWTSAGGDLDLPGPLG